jgi:methyltransferase (TIGR00027 family)
MRFDGPSLTAVSAARRRAIHQMLDGGAIFEDPVTLALLGLELSEVDPALRTDQSSQRMRWFIAARIRFAEDRSRAAIRFGLSQVVVLGAGLDSFAYRLTSDPSVTVFKVDHPHAGMEAGAARCGTRRGDDHGGVRAGRLRDR